MAAVSQTTLSNAFSWMKMLEFRLRFHWSLFLRVQLTITGDKPLSKPMNQWWLVYWRIYASLGLNELRFLHHSDVIMSAMACQITSVTIVYSTVCSGADQRKHQSSASLALVRETHRWLVNSPHKVPVTQKMFPFDDVIMLIQYRAAIH